MYVCIRLDDIYFFFFFSSRRRHTRSLRHWSSDVCSTDLDVRRGPRFASSDLLLRAAAQGLGVALARHRLAQEALASGSLVRPFETRVIDLGAAYWIVRPRGGAPREAVTILLAWLRRQAERTPLVRAERASP